MDARQDLKDIREVMDRARSFRHLTPAAAFVAGGLAVTGGAATHFAGGGLLRLAVLWLAVLAAAAGAAVFFGDRSARRRGEPLFSPLAGDVLNCLWPPLLVAAALAAVLVGGGRLDLVPPLFMLCYGVAAISAGAFGPRGLRLFGAAFLAAGIVGLAVPIPPGLAMASTFGLFHLALGAHLAAARR